MSRKDGFELSVPQSHELFLALRRAENIGWTPKLLHELMQGNLLQQVRQVLLGSAQIIESGRLTCNGSFILPARRCNVSMKTLFQVRTDQEKGVVMKTIDLHFSQLFLQVSERLNIDRPDQEIHCFELGDTQKYALMELDVAEIFGHISCLTFTLEEIWSILQHHSRGQTGLLDVEGKPNHFLVHAPNGSHQWVYFTFLGYGWCVGATEAFTFADVPIYFHLGERFFAKKHYLKK